MRDLGGVEAAVTEIAGQRRLRPSGHGHRSLRPARPASIVGLAVARNGAMGGLLSIEPIFMDSPWSPPDGAFRLM
jgi:hypothetical protein